MAVRNLVKCSKEYWNFVRNLRNQNIGFVNQGNITSEQQTQYMTKYSDNYKVCLVNEFPAGFIGIIDNDIRFAVAEEFRNQGLAKWMLHKFPIPKNTIGKVKKDNLYSCKLFLSLNWQEIIDENKEFFIFKK